MKSRFTNSALTFSKGSSWLPQRWRYNLPWPGTNAIPTRRFHSDEQAAGRRAIGQADNNFRWPIVLSPGREEFSMLWEQIQTVEA